MTVEPDVIDRALLACVRGDPEDPAPAASLRRLPDGGWTEFIARCKAQRVGPIIYARIVSAGLEAEIPPDTLHFLRRRYRSNSIRNLWLQEAIHSVVTTCQEAGVPVILLKGAYIATRVYPNPALREMGDIDLLVRGARLHDAMQLLHEKGFRSNALSPTELLQHLATAKHVPRLHKGKAAVELHWTIFPPRRGETDEIEGLWRRAVPATVARVDTLALSREDLLLHVCGHAAYGHRFQFGLRPLIDIDHLIRTSGNDIDWTSLIERAGVWRWQRGVYLSLHLARELIGAGVPNHVLSALVPPSATSQVVATARHMVFTDPSDSRALHLNIVDWHRGSLAQRVRLMCTRIRWRPQHVEPTFGYYVRHIASLCRRHLPNVLRLLSGNRATRQLADGKQVLAAWLREGESPASEDLETAHTP